MTTARYKQPHVHRWLVPGGSPIVFDYRQHPYQGLLVEYCDGCYRVRWTRPEWLTEDGRYAPAATSIAFVKADPS